MKKPRNADVQKRPVNRVLMTGNEAMAEAAIRSGCDFYAGYPITPQNELIAYMARHLRQHNRIFIQAESEIAAINMVFGAAATGKRAMTSSSSPGISLKQEGISYLAGAELPAVIINVMRGGPGLGNIASAQGDYFQSTRGGGHGDYFTPSFSPWSVQEAAELVALAFDFADYYRTPIVIVADAIVGQMMEPVDLAIDSGFKKRLPPKNWALTGAKARTANVIKSFFLHEGMLEKHNQKLQDKWANIKKNEQRFASYGSKRSDNLVIAYGSQARIAKEAVDILRKEGCDIGLFRPITLWPYPKDGLRQCSEAADNLFVIEQSLGQMIEDVRLNTAPQKKIHFLGKAGGGIPSVSEIVQFVKRRIKFAH